MADKLLVQIEIDVFEREEELPEAERALMARAREATNTAYAPYSGFLVGAALLLEDGSIHTGNNQENAAYPSGLCAERTALFGLRCHLPDTCVTMVAVTARRRADTHYLPVTPCGSCRQVMAEYENRQGKPIQLLMQAPDGRYFRFFSIKDLLPFQFSGESLQL
jgi:cytidine deaminase